MSRIVCPGRVVVALVAALTLSGALTPSAQGRAQERVGQPQITSISPVTKASDKAQPLTVNGRNFAEGLSLEVTSPEGQAQVLSGQDIRDLRETSFQVAIVLPRGGTYSFVVRNRDGGASNAFPLKVPPTATAPSIERVEPTSVPRSTSPTRLTVLGRNFVAGLSVTLTDPTGEVTVIKDGIGTVTATSFTVDLNLTVAGEYSLLVTNPSTENSNSVAFTVSNGR
jgi:hypothetical protein